MVKIPPFDPTAPVPAPKPEPMVVVTCRLPREHRIALTEVWRQDASYSSFSHVVQVAVEQFLERQRGEAPADESHVELIDP